MKSPYLITDLLELELRVLKKIERLIAESPDSFPIDRLKKGKQMQVLSKSIRLLIENNLEDEAEILLDLLLDLGADLPRR
jgi:hypothetical protein